MTHINEKEEKCLDDGNTIKLIRGDKQFTINYDNVVCWGEIDYNNEEDLEIIYNKNLLNHLIFRGEDVPANYDYESNSIIDENKIPKYIDTTRIELITRFRHGLLGKPKRTVIFKHIVIK